MTGRKVTAAELAEKFEVSRCTVIRDIEDIFKAGIPVVIFTSEEIQIILAGLHGLDNVAESGRYRQIADMLLFSHMKTDGQIIIDLSVWGAMVRGREIISGGSDAVLSYCIAYKT